MSILIQIAALNKEYKSTWMCPFCINVKRRVRSNDSAGSSTAPPPGDELMNMSCDIPEPPANSPSSDSASSRILLTPKYEVTMEKISTLLDEKLSASLTMFMESFRKAIREDVKDMVKSEIGSAICNIKDEFSATTDFICAEQKTLQERIDNATEMNRLNNRLAGMEKITRGCNIELQAVPERRNENVLTLFRKLCDVVNVAVDDGQISACRRVAKQNTASNRPRNIVVTFSSPRIRDMVLSATHRYNKAHPGRGLVSSDLDIPGETCRFYVTEHLSPEQKSLHAAARKAAKDHSFKYVWIKNGQIYMRKDESSGAILVKTMEYLNKMY
ncbi:hypothetical protein ABMA28_001792 [Loxostege sticticalis]|uniref:FP protein C-terminal domain-containing protein n=1 Tax=Loxostege sticticalis TaxID=481309 RepID=A0ABD0T703_LOXSC